MSDVIDISKILAKGTHAEEALRVLAPYLDDVETAIFEKWKESAGQDSEGRERLYYLYRALQEVRASCRGTINRAKRAKKQTEVNNGATRS